MTTGEHEKHHHHVDQPPDKKSKKRTSARGKTSAVVHKATHHNDEPHGGVSSHADDAARPTDGGATTSSISSSHVASEQPRGHIVVRRGLFSMKAFDASRQLPIVYSDHYNVNLFHLQSLHQFDGQKYAKLASYLQNDFADISVNSLAGGRAVNTIKSTSSQPTEESPEDSGATVGAGSLRRLKFVSPNRPINMQELLIHHSSVYLDSVHSDKSFLARTFEQWVLNLLPMCSLESRLLTPLRWQVAGTIFAAHLAMRCGWSINLAGGFHNARRNFGHTFCLYSDVMLALKWIWRKHPLQRFLIIDLDAHQAAGLAHDLLELSARRRKMVFLLDIFNDSIQPPDRMADKGTDMAVELSRYTGDKTYLKRLEDSLDEAFNRFKPSMVIYISGQDVLREDSLGMLSLSDRGLRKRDELVFSRAIEQHKCPIVMLLGGGFVDRGIQVQADSIRNLSDRGLLKVGRRRATSTTGPEPENKTRTRSQSNRRQQDVAAKGHKSHLEAPPAPQQPEQQQQQQQQQQHPQPVQQPVQPTVPAVKSQPRQKAQQSQPQTGPAQQLKQPQPQQSHHHHHHLEHQHQHQQPQPQHRTPEVVNVVVPIKPAAVPVPINQTNKEASKRTQVIRVAPINPDIIKEKHSRRKKAVPIQEPQTSQTLERSEQTSELESPEQSEPSPDSPIEDQKSASDTGPRGRGGGE